MEDTSYPTGNGLMSNASSIDWTKKCNEYIRDHCDGRQKYTWKDYEGYSWFDDDLDNDTLCKCRASGTVAIGKFAAYLKKYLDENESSIDSIDIINNKLNITINSVNYIFDAVNQPLKPYDFHEEFLMTVNEDIKIVNKNDISKYF